jgi:hypothetical protein
MEVKVPALSSDAKDSYNESVSTLLIEDEDDNDGDGLAPCITLPTSFPSFLERKHFATKNAKAGVLYLQLRDTRLVWIWINQTSLVFFHSCQSLMAVTTVFPLFFSFI